MLFWATAEAFLYDSSKETPDEFAVCLKERKAREERYQVFWAALAGRERRRPFLPHCLCDYDYFLGLLRPGKSAILLQNFHLSFKYTYIYTHTHTYIQNFISFI